MHIAKVASLSYLTHVMSSAFFLLSWFGSTLVHVYSLFKCYQELEGELYQQRQNLLQQIDQLRQKETEAQRNALADEQ